MKVCKKGVIGLDFDTKSYGKCVVITYEDAHNVTVRFYEYPCIVKCQMSHLKRGQVKNPMCPTFYGKGYIGVGKYKGGKNPVFCLWVRILERAYNKNYHLKFPTYKDVEVCEDWLNFQNFAEWCETQEFFNAKDCKGKTYQLDKDLLYKGNKTYSPETCCFVPSEINGLLLKNDKDRGEYPIGVHPNKTHTRFRAHVRCFGKLQSLGSFKTPEEAFLAYKTAKEGYIKEVAEVWRGKIDDKVYKGLLCYKVENSD